MRREAVIVYVADEQMRARSRAEHIHNPRTALQQANRSKMGIASHFLRHMQAMVAHGFLPTYTERNGRKVGAYHVALGRLLQEAMVQTGGAWEIDPKRVTLAEGNSLERHPASYARKGRNLRLDFSNGLPKGVGRIRIAVYCPATGRASHFVQEVELACNSIQLWLPKWARGQALHLWWMVECKGRMRWSSSYLAVGAKDTRGGQKKKTPHSPLRRVESSGNTVRQTTPVSKRKAKEGRACLPDDERQE
ncbi:MAG: hypothetical protein CSA97_00680 [Bacteroidetes bacterium]|nr:MAG: hypothetical protein CSA97_00680 [Bacteroidota bacterium]